MSSTEQESAETEPKLAAEEGTLVLERHPKASWLSRGTLVVLWLTVRKLMALIAYMPRIRYPWALVDMLARLVVFPERGFRGDLVRLPNCDGRWFTADGKDGPRAILYLHGGAFVTCGIHTHRRLATKIAHTARASVLMVDYRLLPEYCVDDAVKDCVLGYRWLLDRGYSPGQISIAGDSAGGYLTFATAFRLREEGLPLPASLVGLSPFTDWAIRTKSTHPNVRIDGLLPRPFLYYVERKVEEAQARCAVGGAPPPKIDLYAQPIEGFPPALLHASAHEALLPDAQRLAETLSAAGVPVTLKLWPGQAHVFQALDLIVPEGKIAIAQIGKFIHDTAKTPAAPTDEGS